jgi:hypothetical protein
MPALDLGGSGHEATAPPYITLIASLPILPDILVAKQTPISRLRLEQRLRDLLPEDKALLDDILDLLAWRRLDLGESDAHFMARARRLIPRLPTPALRRAIEYRLEARTILAALRRRRRGQTAPAADGSWGYGRWTRTIAANWQEPGLGIEQSFPWVREAAEHIRSGDAVALESLLMRQLWTITGRLGVGHAFDFTAVALYALRYQLIERRVAYDAEAATARFRRLVDQGFATFAGQATA